MNARTIRRFAVVPLLMTAAMAFADTATPWRTGTYAYDGAENIKSIGSTEEFRYDAFGRLVRGTAGAGGQQTVTYDRFGNIRTMTTGSGSTLAFGVNAADNRLAYPIDPVTGQPYNVFATYDDAGQLTSELGGVGNAYAYDSLAMITRATVDGAVKVNLYTAADQRIASVTIAGGVESTSEWTVRGPSSTVQSRFVKSGSSWTWTEDYIHAGGKLLAAETAGAEGTRHFFPDHLNSPRLITGNGGATIGKHAYYPFGAEATLPSTDGERLKFTGHERDSPSLDYMHARFYNPMWGRFLSVDRARTWTKATKNPQAWNRYTYARNNPLKFIDPDGLDEIKFGKATVTIWPGEALYIRSGNNDHVAVYVGTDAKGAINVLDSTHERNADLSNNPRSQLTDRDNTGSSHYVHDLNAPVNGKANPFSPAAGAEVVGVVHTNKPPGQISEGMLKEAASDVKEYHQDEEFRQCTTFAGALADEADYSFVDRQGDEIEDLENIETLKTAADPNMVKR